MDGAIESVLREYEQRSAAEMKRMSEMPPAEMAKHIDEFLLPVGPATGQLMNILVKEAKSRTILEIGTSHGYSTVWLAEAARATGGKVITLDVHAGKQEYARNALGKAGLASFVEFKLGDARESIASLKDPIDFVLLDLWKDLYIPCFNLFYPKLNAGAIIVADNMVFPEFSRHDAEEYRKHVRAKPDIQSVLLPVGSGIELSRCVRGLELK
jgi:predicted O-methyltransferase YrrM